MTSPTARYASRGSQRLEAARAALDLEGVDHVVVSAPEDVRWLSGFTGSHGWLVVTSDRLILVTDGRYKDQGLLESRELGVDAEIELVTAGEQLADLVARIVPSTARTFFQPHAMVMTQFRSLESRLSGQLEPVDPIFSQLRRHKDDREVAAMATAARIADDALAALLAALNQGHTERHVRNELEYSMRTRGADGPSYDTIVATGPLNAPKPHHHPDDTVIESGHSVVIDVGAMVEGYHSDMTRTYLIGGVAPELQRLYEIVREAQEIAVDAVRPGVPCREIDAMCRRVFKNHDVEDLFTHGTGHGVGLAIHEEPFLGPSSAAILQVGDVVTVEPGLYRMGLGGARIEDLLVVTDSGSRRLTSLPKDSPCLPSPPTT